MSELSERDSGLSKGAGFNDEEAIGDFRETAVALLSWLWSRWGGQCAGGKG